MLTSDKLTHAASKIQSDRLPLIEDSSFWWSGHSIREFFLYFMNKSWRGFYCTGALPQLTSLPNYLA